MREYSKAENFEDHRDDEKHFLFVIKILKNIEVFEHFF